MRTITSCRARCYATRDAVLALALAAAPVLHALETPGHVSMNDLPQAPAGVQTLANLPLSVDSRLEGDITSGTVTGRLDFPFSKVRQVLRAPANWCGILALHLNVKACTYTRSPGTVLTVYVGQKEFQAAAQATRMQYVFDVEQDTSALLGVRLQAPRGPLGSRDYAISLHARPLDDTHTTVSLRYQYKMGTRGKLALQAYLNTTARAKVGFTVLRVGNDGNPVYIAGIRGMTERNVVRYYFAITAYLDCVTPTATACTDLPAAALRWYDLTSHFATQLFEVSRTDYLNIKQLEFAQQAQLQAGG